MKSLSLLLCGAVLLSAVSAQSVISSSCNASQYPSGGYCVNYDMNSDKGSADKNIAIDTGSTAWVLAATALTMLITPAIGLFYAGLYKAEHATNTILLAFVGLAVITIEWILFGYSFSFGPGSKGYGNFKWGLYYHVAADPSGNYVVAIPHILYAAFQNMFAAMAPVFLAGAVVGRMKFGTYILFIILYTLIVYNCLAHWIWGNTIDPTTWQPAQLGWLNIRGTIDYAGGAVIHITAGFAALATSIVIGKRREYNRAVRTFPQPHNLPLVAIGITLIWFGWFGYTGGANGTADGVAAHALINTQIAASTGLLWWLIIEYIVDRRTTLIGASYGALTGLVAITPAAGYIWPWASIMYGIFAVSFVYAFSRLKYILRYDDPFDVFAIHGIGGSVGMFMTGLFATPNVNSAIQGGAFYGPRVQLGYQMAGIVVAAAFSFVCTFIIVFILKKTVGIRVTDAEEDLGLDHKYHGAPAYFFEEPVVNEEVKKVVYTNGEQQVVHHHVHTDGLVHTEQPLHGKKEEHVISS